MDTPELIAGLRAKQTALMEDIHIAEQMLAKLRTDQSAIIAAIRVFDPAAPTKPPAPDVLHFPHGHLSRAILDILRRSEVALPPRDIAVQLLADRGNADPDAETLDNALNRVRTALQRMKDRLEKEERGQTAYWKVAD